ncbi:MAG: SDR family NAD(P)-dependent oxidoreductase [Dehalococcoidia bacterium]|jgi:NAD(P)-dependent dehydrogenase (short-subunit alcohol dehydrogenase family)
MNKIALVSGSNQGLGFALVEALCRNLGPDASVYLTARNAIRGEEAIRQLRTRGLSPIFHLLDVTDDASVAMFAETIRRRHGGVDIVISNAAARISRNLSQAKQVALFINTNNHGTFRMIRAFGPMLRDNARFLVVASEFGSLRNLSPSLHGEFDVMTRSLEDIERLMDEYVSLVEVGKGEAHQWPGWINIPSKVAQVASTRIMARLMREEASRRGLLINAVCPGMVDTDASRPWFDDMSAAQSPAQASVDVVWLATLPSGTEAPYGELVQHQKVLPWL